MTKIEILHRFAESYTTLMELLVRESNLVHQNTEHFLHSLSSNTANGTQMDIVNSKSILSPKEYEDIEKIFWTILLAIDEKYYDGDAIKELAESTKQILSRFIIPKKKEPLSSIKELYQKVIESSSIADDTRLLVDSLKSLIYEN